MKYWLRKPLASAITAVMSSVTRGRPMPLKNPSIAHTAAPNGAPATRGSQNCAARR